jgi:hypothetical protein
MSSSHRKLSTGTTAIKVESIKPDIQLSTATEMILAKVKKMINSTKDGMGSL